MTLIRLNRHPRPRQLLVFALAWAAFTGAAGWRLRAGGHRLPADLCWVLTVVVPVAGAFWREGLRRLYVGLSLATYPIGLVVSSAVLLVIYYAVLTPLGLILRVCGHDPLQRRPAATYWHKRPAPRDAASYFRQH